LADLWYPKVTSKIGTGLDPFMQANDEAMRNSAGAAGRCRWRRMIPFIIPKPFSDFPPEMSNAMIRGTGIGGLGLYGGQQSDLNN
jgi:hypothetical protein